jgi:hypothetical protein
MFVNIVTLNVLQILINGSSFHGDFFFLLGNYFGSGVGCYIATGWNRLRFFDIYMMLGGESRGRRFCLMNINILLLTLSGMTLGSHSVMSDSFIAMLK